MYLPPVPEEWMRPKVNPEKIIIYWESHREELTFIKEFIRDSLLNDREYLCIVWDKTLQPDHDNGWTRIWIVTYILQDYKDLIINQKQLPAILSTINDLKKYLDENNPGRDIGLNEISLRKLISRTYKQLRDFYNEKGFLL